MYRGCQIFAQNCTRFASTSRKAISYLSCTLSQHFGDQNLPCSKLLCPPNILYTFKVFWDIPSCPSAVKFDISMPRVVYQVLTSQEPNSDIPTMLNVLKEFIAASIDQVIEANGGVPVSFPRDAAKERYQLALFESIKLMDPTSHTCT